MGSVFTTNRIDGNLLERLLNRYAGGIGLYAVENGSVAFLFASEEYKSLALKAADVFATHSLGEAVVLSNSQGLLYKTIMEAFDLGESQAELKTFDAILKIKAEKLDDDSIIIVRLYDFTEQRSIDTKLKLNEDIIRSVLSETDISIWDYHIDNNCIIKLPYSNDFNRTLEPPTPETFVANGYVHSDYAEDFLDMFRDIANGKEKVSGTFLIKDMNTCEYKQETFKFKCNKSGTGHSIGISTPHHEAASSSSCGLSADNIDNESDELNIDEITGLYNKAYTLRSVSCQVSHSSFGSTHCLLLFDLDNFSAIVETLGHEAGNEILERFGNLLTSVFYTTDTIGRMGDDEFVIYMPNVSDAAVKSMLQEFYDMLLENSFSPQFRICASVGVVVFTKEDFEIDDVMQKAEKALQKAKDSGKNKYIIYRP